MQPLVSIIIPVYNVELYLDRCINSVLAQTYKNIEVILIDDGSSDNSSVMCDNFAASDARIIVVHKENGGQSDARNVGLDLCKGDYISFVDSDDWIAINYIEKLLFTLENMEADMAIGNHQQELTDGSFVYRSNQRDECLDKSKALDILIKEPPIQFVLACGKLYKRDLFLNLRFPKGMIYEDQRTNYILFFLSKKIACTSEVLYHYIKRDDSTMGKNPNGDYTPIEEEQAVFFKKNGYKKLSYLIYYRLFWRRFNQYVFRGQGECELDIDTSLKFYLKSLHELKGVFGIQPYILSILFKYPCIYVTLKKITSCKKAFR
ncbi:glycosyltransferase family 2 protein [Candidatus Saccharibacteria bacterium]|nr:glycosyltransferase family 2 protein [Candidatus Saccharibacteria bacterium]